MAQNLIKLELKNVSGVTFCSVKTSEVVKKLPASAYKKYSNDLEFAGVSARGIPLSKAKTQGPANISGYPIRLVAPVDWVCVRHNVALPLNTNTPDIVAVLPTMWGSLQIYVNPTNIYHRTQAYNQAILDKEYPRHDLILTELNSEVINLHRKHQDSLLIIDQNFTRLALPHKSVLTKAEWLSIGRHIFTGAPSAEFEDTVTIGASFTGYEFSGNTVQDVTNKWGITGTPEGKTPNGLVFPRFKVTDATKASRWQHVLRYMEGKNIKAFQEFGCNNWAIEVKSLLANRRLLAVIDEVGINANGQRVSTKTPLKDDLLDAPLCIVDLHADERVVICPIDKVDEFLMSTKEASRRYQLPPNTIKYVLCYRVDRAVRQAGTWILKEFLDLQLDRNHKEEADQRNARKQSLEAKYGTLPILWRTFSDAQLADHFEIKSLVDKGTLVALHNSPFIPVTKRGDFLHWLKTETVVAKIGKSTYEDPINNEQFVRNFESMSELAVLPGFWEMVQKAFGEKDWLQKLFLCEEVRAAALASTF